ncbi:MAG: tripartite tricarboxylate transporter substrate binding protein [Betaproteobacteria bacterium]
MKFRTTPWRPLAGSAALLLATMFSQAASAQDYPNKPITLIAPYAAGGDSDASARNLSAVAPKYFSQPVIVQNIVGASGIIGSQKARTSPADGYTLLIARGGSQAINPALDSKTPYKWNDFTFLSLLDFNPVACVVRGDSPYKTMKDLLAALKANPGKLNYATAGPGTTQHLAVEVLLKSAGLPSNSAEQIGYKGGGEATQAVLTNTVQFLCNNLPTLGGQLKAGTMRGLLTTTTERLKEYPDIPTARELNLAPMEDVMGWSGLYGPPGLPPEVVNKWVETLKKVAQDPDWLRGNASFGGVPAIRSQADTEKFAHEQYDLYVRLGDALGLRK